MILLSNGRLNLTNGRFIVETRFNRSFASFLYHLQT
jgi:hypothetical protein